MSIWWVVAGTGLLGFALFVWLVWLVWLVPVGSMAPTLRQRAEWKADAYIAAVFHGTGATMETILAERDRYVAELLRRWGEPGTH